jgi:hypothetical protein
LNAPFVDEDIQKKEELEDQSKFFIRENLRVSAAFSSLCCLSTPPSTHTARRVDLAKRHTPEVLEGSRGSPLEENPAILHPGLALAQRSNPRDDVARRRVLVELARLVEVRRFLLANRYSDNFCF